MLQRAARDGVISAQDVPAEPKDEQAIFKSDGPLALDDQIVLEEYCFKSTGVYPTNLANTLSGIVDDHLFKSIAERLVILSNGMMSHFATNACEVAQHVRISDETGTAEGTGLFNQENVPADTLFYSVIHGTKSRVPSGLYFGKSESEALDAFTAKVSNVKVFQFGGDASTGLGFCSASTSNETKGA
jgi:CRISPR-associated protein Cmr4